MSLAPAQPTLLCHAWAAYKLLGEGRADAAEDELAAAFGRQITRIRRNGRLIAKWNLPTEMSPEMELAALQQIEAAVESQYGPRPTPTEPQAVKS